jgi:tetratricopeptide (TPR) repeat protein
MMRRLLILAFVMFVARGAAAANDGGTESPFALGVGSRELALGGADLALSDPATAPFWNASRLALAERFALSAFHSRLYAQGVAYQYLGIVIPTLDLGGFGIGVFRHGVSGIDKRDAVNQPQGEISLNQFRMYFAYGRTISNTEVGVALSLEHQSLDEYKGTSSPGLDLALSRRLDLKSEHFTGLTLAVNGRNLLQPGLKLAQSTYKYPRGVDVGASLEVHPNATVDHRLTLAARLNKRDQARGRVGLGVEYSLARLLSLRTGLREGQPSFGVGLAYKLVSFDYAAVDRELGFLHMFTLGTSFGASTTERRAQRAERREREFNRLMSEHFTEQNRTLMTRLIVDGNEQLAAGRLEEAVSSFDRALLLARNVSGDTTRIRNLSSEAHEKLERANRDRRHGEFVDSAETHLERGDFLLARYFATKALTEVPASESAAVLLNRADNAVAASAQTSQWIDRQLSQVDSLVASGRLEEAEALVESLLERSPSDDGVRLAAMRVEMARLRGKLAFAGERQPEETIAAPTMTAPATEARESSAGTPTAPTELLPPAVAATPEPLSPELRKEVESAYRAAQEAFNRGELPSAIASWEKVERLAPDYLSVRVYLVEAYKFVGVELYAQKRRADAVAIWKKASNLDPDDAEIGEYIRHTELEIQKLRSLSYDRP